jgi:hypothetical protein
MFRSNVPCDSPRAPKIRRLLYRFINGARRNDEGCNTTYGPPAASDLAAVAGVQSAERCCILFEHIALDLGDRAVSVGSLGEFGPWANGR